MTRERLSALWRDKQISRGEYARELDKLPPEVTPDPYAGFLARDPDEKHECPCCHEFHRNNGWHCAYCERGL